MFEKRGDCAKYWGIIADNLNKAGWTSGLCVRFGRAAANGQKKPEATKSKTKLKRFRLVESGRVSRILPPDYISLPRLEPDCWLPTSEVPTFWFSG